MMRFLHIVFWFLVLFVIAFSFFTRQTWGEIDLPQLLFFAQTNLNGVNTFLLLKGVFICVVVPIIVIFILSFLLQWMGKENRIMQLCCFIFLDVFLFLGAALCVSRQFSNYLSFEKIDFYKNRYVNVDDIHSNSYRNVIVLFAESLEKKNVVWDNEKLRIDDADAIKFDNLTEGYAQRWTQGALFSAFTGVHIHFLSEYLRYALHDKVKWWNGNPEMNIVASHRVGQNYDFYLPNIKVLSDITLKNGYQNLFVQGGYGAFSGTDHFLQAHGFDENNFYSYKDFKGWKNFNEFPDWWGMDDASVFRMLEEKITAIDKSKPFFVVAFTLDLHFGNNPFYNDEESIVKSTIVNINHFIQWFREQSFYENTTLVIVGDHKRMGPNVEPGGGIYNAFFNLPEEFKVGLNVHRSFNQIDMFPTLLEILGFDLPNHKAGMGVSLFSNEKTLAEEYSYDKQAEIFGKLDDFYQKLWSREKFLP